MPNGSIGIPSTRIPVLAPSASFGNDTPAEDRGPVGCSLDVEALPTRDAGGFEVPEKLIETAVQICELSSPTLFVVPALTVCEHLAVGAADEVDRLGERLARSVEWYADCGVRRVVRIFTGE